MWRSISTAIRLARLHGTLPSPILNQDPKITQRGMVKYNWLGAGRSGPRMQDHCGDGQSLLTNLGNGWFFRQICPCNELLWFDIVRVSYRAGRRGVFLLARVVVHSKHVQTENGVTSFRILTHLAQLWEIVPVQRMHVARVRRRR